MRLLLFFLLPLTISAHPHIISRNDDNGTSPAISGLSIDGAPIPARGCGTGPPSIALIDEHKALQANSSNSTLSKRASPKTTKYTVPVYFHVVLTNDQSSLITPSMVSNQFGQLQRAYANSNITFQLAGVDFTVNDDWATDADDSGMKQALRRGNYSTLNVYFQSNLSTNAYGTPSLLLGFCTLPTNVTYVPCAGCAPVEYPTVDYALDGCNVLAGSMPGGPVLGYNTGKTAVHEVGHWFGLLHTFQDNTCDSTDPGDYIDDTPQESVSTDGCPVGKDSCPGSLGLDPIHNYMDYSTDACYEAFTPDQTKRMHDMYGSLRFTY